MYLKKMTWFLGGALFIASIAACRAPSSPTPIAIPTPNLTLTALFEPTETIPPSVTPPAIQTATPMDAAVASPTPVPTQTSSPDEAVTKEAPTAPADSPAATSTPVIPDERPGATVDAFYFDTPPSIDGDLEDWDLDTYPLVAVVYDPLATHTGPADLSGTFMVGWNESQLYIAAQVLDDVHVQNETGRLLYMGDSLEVLLDRNLRADFSSNVLSADDYQIGMSLGATIGEAVEAYLWNPVINEGPRVLINISASATDTGYQVEMAIPWSVFGLVPSAGDLFGFGFSLSDNDEIGTSLQQSMVSNLSIREFYDPTTWGNLVLIKP